MNQQQPFQLPDNETIKKEWQTRDSERRSTLDQLGYDVIDQPGGEPKIVKKSDAYLEGLNITSQELSIEGQKLTNEGKRLDLQNPPMTDKEMLYQAKSGMVEDINKFYEAGKQKEPGATEKVLYPMLKIAYPEIDDKEIWDSIYNLRKPYETGTDNKSGDGWLKKITNWFTG
jgi:hypothetical protein